MKKKRIIITVVAVVLVSALTVGIVTLVNANSRTDRLGKLYKSIVTKDRDAVALYIDDAPVYQYEFDTVKFFKMAANPDSAAALGLPTPPPLPSDEEIWKELVRRKITLLEAEKEGCAADEERVQFEKDLLDQSYANDPEGSQSLFDAMGITREDYDSFMLEWNLYIYAYGNMIAKIPNELLDGTRHVDSPALNAVIAENKQKRDILNASHGTSGEIAAAMDVTYHTQKLMDAYIDYCAEQYDIRIAE